MRHVYCRERGKKTPEDPEKGGRSAASARGKKASFPSREKRGGTSAGVVSRILLTSVSGRCGGKREKGYHPGRREELTSSSPWTKKGGTRTRREIGERKGG